MNGKIPTDPILARIVRVYFKELKNPDKISALLIEPECQYGGWREDETGKYLRLLVIGDISSENLTTERFSKYGNIEKVALEDPWPGIPRKLTVNPLSAEI
jgi:hypothetical protein